MLLTEIADFGVEVRFTDDNRVSVYDAIEFATRDKNPRATWKRLEAEHPELVANCYKYKFPGRGGKARPTPVADFKTFLEILVVLPGRLAAHVRGEAVRTLIRAMDGDLTLVDEILERVKGSQQKVPSVGIVEDFELYTEPEYFGTLSKPLTNIPTPVKSGYGWKGNEMLMESWLTRLASYRGMYIHRQSPHRGYHPTGKIGSRRVDLILIPFFDNDPDVLDVYEFKSDYIDDYDVKDTFYSKNYIDIVIRDFLNKGFKFRKVRGRLVAPGGITKSAVEELIEIQKILRERYKDESFEIELDALPLHQMVWNEMYSTIASRYEDDEGRYGYGFVLNSVQNLCRMLTDPTPWITFQKSFKRQLLETRKNEFLSSSEDHQEELSKECDQIAASMIEVLIESSFGNELK